MADVDGLGHVNNVVFLTYLEEGRDAFYKQALGRDPHYVVARAEIDWRAEVRYDDKRVLVRVAVERVGTASLTTRETIVTPSGATAARRGSSPCSGDVETRKPTAIHDNDRARRRATCNQNDPRLRLRTVGAPSSRQARKPRNRSLGRAATLLLLAALASPAVGCGAAGDETILPAGACDHFTTTVRASGPSYGPGQTVIIAVTQTNEGPACNRTPPEWCGNLQAFASAANAAGRDVWDSDATATVPGQYTCPFAPAPGPLWPPRYANTQYLDWHQDDCADAGETAQAGRAEPGLPHAGGGGHLPDRRQRDVSAGHDHHYGGVAGRRRGP